MSDLSDIEAEHKAAQESGEVFEGQQEGGDL